MELRYPQQVQQIPCRCGENRLRVVHQRLTPEHKVVIYCPKCKTQGPIGNSSEQALKMWNALQLIS